MAFSLQYIKSVPLAAPFHLNSFSFYIATHLQYTLPPSIPQVQRPNAHFGNTAPRANNLLPFLRQRSMLSVMVILLSEMNSYRMRVAMAVLSPSKAPCLVFALRSAGEQILVKHTHTKWKSLIRDMHMQYNIYVMFLNT